MTPGLGCNPYPVQKSRPARRLFCFCLPLRLYT
nr:MAG TPA: hypothetical protein [Caudoviricetes sp.]